MPLSHLTEQQLDIVNHVASSSGLTLVSAVAGSGKTTLLKAIADSVPHDNSLYISYNSSLANEAKRKFPKSVDCRTSHSLAYQSTVKPFKLSVGFFGPKQVTEDLPYDYRYDFAESLRAFCLSTHLTWDDYHAEHDLPDYYLPMGHKYLDLMHSGKIDCTHDYYLKLFHLLLANGDITYSKPFDLILWDEIQDMAPVAAAIFELLPATRKIGVGDKFQAIYSFNHTVNYFDICPKSTLVFYMTQSFRVPTSIAKYIDKFAKSYLDPAMHFEGVDIQRQPVTRAYIARTNASLITKMIDLNSMGIQYTLLRKPDDIFKLPLIICSLRYKGFISSPEYKHLQADFNTWYESRDLKLEYKSPLSYLLALYGTDLQLKTAINLVVRYGKPLIIQTYETAKSHLKAKSNYTLCTSHSSKGLEFDEVTLAPDMNDSIDEPIALIKSGVSPSDLSLELRESLNLYYVACSRAMVSLHNATHL